MAEGMVVVKVRVSLASPTATVMVASPSPVAVTTPSSTVRIPSSLDE